MTSRFFRFLPLAPLLAVCGSVYGHFYFRGLSIDSVGNLLRFRAPYRLEASRLIYSPLNRFLIETAKTFGIDDEIRIAVAINILCALAALAFLYLFLDRLFRNPGLAFLGTGLVAFAPSFWWYCELIEVHSLNLFALFLFCWCSLRAFQLGVDPDKSPWRQTPPRLLALLGTLVSGVFYVLTHSSSVFWLAALACACMTSGRCWRALFGFRSEPRFTRGLLMGLAIAAMGSIAGAWFLRDSVVHYYHVRIGFWGLGLDGYGAAKMIPFTFQQCFGQSFLVSCFAVAGGVLFFKRAAPVWIKKTLLFGVLIHFVFLYFWVPNHGAFFLPLYPLLIAFSLLAARETFRRFRSGFPEALLGVVGAAVFLVFLWTFRVHLGIASVSLFLAISLGLGFFLTKVEPAAGRDRRRLVLGCVMGSILLFLQVWNALPEIQGHYLVTHRIDQAKALGRLSGPRTLIVSTALTQYIRFFTKAETFSLGKANLKRPTPTGQPYDEHVASRIRRALRNRRPVLMSGESRKYLDMNAEYFPALTWFLRNRVRFHPIERNFRLTLVPSKPQDRSLSPGPKDDRP